MTNIEMETMSALKNSAREYTNSKHEQQRFTAAMNYAVALMNSHWYTGMMEDAVNAGVEFADELINKLKK